MPEVLTIPEAAKYLQLGKDAVYKMAQQWTIPARKIRGKWRFSRVACQGRQGIIPLSPALSFAHGGMVGKPHWYVIIWGEARCQLDS